MSVITDLYSVLNTDAGVMALVGTGSSPQQSRIYPMIAPESAALPLIEYSTVSEIPISTIAGVDDMDRHRIQMSCHAATFDDAETLADAVFAALEGNGYQELRLPAYQAETKTFSVFIDWSFLA